MIAAEASSSSRGGSSKVRPGPLLGPLLALAVGIAVTGTPACPGPAGAARAGPDPPYGLLADSVGFLAAEGTSRSRFGILAVSLDRGDTLIALNPEHRLVPASNMKLFVTGAFLREFGPGARGVTEIAAQGTVGRTHGGRGVKLKGALVLRGSGFPDVYQLLSPGSRGLLDSLAFLLRASGLEKFEGTLWVDGSLFAREPYGPGWAVDDLPWSYGAPVNALLANGNAATLVATATADGVSLALEPPETPLTVAGRVALADSGAPSRLAISRDPGSRVLRVAGQVPRGGAVKRQVAAPDPDSTAGLVLLGAMKRAGIEVRAKVAIVATRGGPGGPEAGGRQVEGPPPTGDPPPAEWRAVNKKAAVPVVRLASPPAAAIVSMVDAYSLNVETEAFLRFLDPAASGKSAAAGLHRLTSILAEAGVDTVDLSLVDGSGLSPLNLATARAFVKWLVFLDRDRVLGGVFRETLAVPGGVGTLQRRFQAIDSTAGLRAKSGTLTNVSALSGYVRSAEGERLAFSILSNGHRGVVAAARSVEESLVGLLARFRRKPPEPARPVWMIPR